MDYFSAMLGLLVALFYAIHRTMSIKLFTRVSSLLFLCSIAFYIVHISYLTFYRFDYGYNMKASVAVGIVHNLLWLAWSFNNLKSTSHAWKMIVVCLGLTAASLLEVFDFPPVLGVFDAHSIWHFATIPCVMIYWDFLLIDSQYFLERTNRKLG